jgi:peptide/nickel transport system ATP-binding protein
MSGALLEVEDLKVLFPLPRPRAFAPHPVVRAVDGVSLEIGRGSSFGVVGESGSGKSTMALACMRLVQATSGAIRFDGTDVMPLDGEALRRLRPRFQIVFQDPYSSLNPRLRAGAVVREPMELMSVGAPGERDRTVAELFDTVGLRPEQRALFPHQFSGGQRQRIAIARALATRPDLLVLDEPVSALDVAIQAQVLNLLRRLQAEFGLTYLFISHDLGVVQYMCNDIAVMYLGQIVERADRRQLFAKPLHPYTQALLAAVPSPQRRAGIKVVVSGDPPSPIDPPAGCRFHPRCPLVQARCREEAPALRPTSGSRLVACHLAE